MEDTQLIALQYKEHDPMKRKMFLDQSIASGEDTEGNAIRKELWDIRYSAVSETGDGRADGYLGLWMSLEYNRDAGRRFFGMKSAKKEIGKHLEKLKFREFQQGDALRQELLYKECCHMVKTYMELCEKDKNYNTIICGIVPIGEKGAKNKLQIDIYETAVQLPVNLDMQEELGIITRAAREAYEKHFPGEGGLDAKTGK